MKLPPLDSPDLAAQLLGGDSAGDFLDPHLETLEDAGAKEAAADALATLAQIGRQMKCPACCYAAHREKHPEIFAEGKPDEWMSKAEHTCQLPQQKK